MWNVNLLAVLASAVASMVIGSVWYGPLFGKKFMEVMGMGTWTPEQKEAMKKQMMFTYLAQFVASLVMFYVLAHVISAFNGMTVRGGMTGALWMWIGFVVPLKLADALWGGKMTMFWLSIGNMLVTLLAAGAIIGGWR